MTTFKRTGSISCLSKGEWSLIKTSDGKLSAILSCSNCGSIYGIWNHTILDDGSVIPSVLHPKSSDIIGCNTCDFHDFIKLDGWKN
jgi:hypothetical protein